MKLRLLLGIFTCLWLAQPCALFAQLPAIQLTSIFPPGGKQGTTVNVAIAGSDLDEADALVFSEPGIIASPLVQSSGSGQSAGASANRFTVAISPETPPGIHEVRAKGRFGLSNPRAFVVGRLTELVDDGTHQSLQTAASLQAPVTVNGRTAPGAVGVFRLDLKQNEQVTVSVAAKEIDSRLEAVLLLVDAAGQELQRVRARSNGHLSLDFTAPTTGAYFLKLSDAVYGGGDNHFYRLTVDAGPIVDFVFPPSGPAGSRNQYSVYGRNLPGGIRDELFSPGGQPLEKLPVIVPLPADDQKSVERLPSGLTPLAGAWLDAIDVRSFANGKWENSVNLYVARSPTVVVEQEPNNASAAPQKIAVPCEFVGRFYPARDVDWIEFDARQGEILWLEAMASQMGLECDPVLVLFRVDRKDGGEQLKHIADADDAEDRNRRIGENFDASSDDPALKFVVPADGAYRLMIRDQLGDSRNNPAIVYRLAIRPPEPDFRLLAYANPPPATQQQQNATTLAGAVLRRGGTAALGITLQRRDEFDGEVSVTVEGLPPGIACSGAVLGGSVTEGSLVFVASDSASAWAGPIKIVGRSRLGERELVHEARYGVAVWGSPNRQQESPRFRLTRHLHLGVIDKEVEPALVQVGDDRIYEATLGGKLEIPVKVTRRGDFKDAIKLVPMGLPQPLRPKDVTLDAKLEGTFEFPLTGQGLRPGAYTFYFKGETKYKYARNPEAVPVAEAEQKRIAELVNKLTAETKSIAEGASEDSVKSAQEKLKQAEQLKAEADKRVADAKQAAQPKDLAIALVSTPVRLRILPNQNKK